MKVLITGGHMGPALAVIAALPKGTQVVYVGRKYSFEGDTGYSLEYQTVQNMGIPFIPLTTGRLQRVLTPHTVRSLLKIPRGIIEAITILRREKPDVVMGFGGYIFFAVGIAAKIVGIPLVIHEQIQKAGMANKILSKFANKICVSWEESVPYFPKDKVVLTGNPLLPFSEKRHFQMPKGELPLLAIMGGSGGSHAINVLVEDSLSQLLTKYRIFHQTGAASEFGDYERLNKIKDMLPETLQNRYEIVKFIPPEDVWGVLKSADGVVSRSGINTVTMLLVLEKKSLLIPLPYGQKNEQLDNARLLAKYGISMVLAQSEANASRFMEAIAAMMDMKIPKSDILAGKAALHKKAAGNIVEVLQLCAQSASKKEKTG